MTQNRQLWFWLAGLAALILAVGVFKDILLPFVAGMAIAYFLNPIADWLEARGLGRGAAAALIIGLSGCALVLAALFVVPLASAQLSQMVTALPGEVERLRTNIDAMARDRLGNNFPTVRTAIEKAIADLPQLWAGSAGAVAAALWNRGLAVVNIVSLLLITPLVAYYLLVDWHHMLGRIASWLPRDHAATIAALAARINQAVSAFVRGQGTICLLLGLLYAIGLSLVGLNYGLVIGLATGLLAFVPMVGWVLGLLTALAAGVMQFGLDAVALAKIAGVLGLGMVLDTALLSPRFVGEKVGLHPVWLIFALFAFSYLLGFVGTLVAVPLAAAVAVLVRHALGVYLDSAYYRGTPGGSVDRQT